MGGVAGWMASAQVAGAPAGQQPAPHPKPVADRQLGEAVVALQLCGSRLLDDCALCVVAAGRDAGQPPAPRAAAAVNPARLLRGGGRASRAGCSWGGHACWAGCAMHAPCTTRSQGCSHSALTLSPPALMDCSWRPPATGVGTSTMGWRAAPAAVPLLPKVLPPLQAQRARRGRGRGPDGCPPQHVPGRGECQQPALPTLPSRCSPWPNLCGRRCCGCLPLQSHTRQRQAALTSSRARRRWSVRK